LPFCIFHFFSKIENRKPALKKFQQYIAPANAPCTHGRRAVSAWDAGFHHSKQPTAF